MDLSSARDLSSEREHEPEQAPPTCYRTMSYCNASTVTYSCDRSAWPAEADCVRSGEERMGLVDRCCRLTDDSTTCSQDSQVTCASGKIGYACAGWDTPAQHEDVICDEASLTASGLHGFCCRRFKASTCKLVYDGGCLGWEYVFSCTSSATPADDDRELDCAPRDNAPSSERIHCCLSHRRPPE